MTVQPFLILALVTLLYGLVLSALAGRMFSAGEPSRDLARKAVHVGVFTGAVPAHLILDFWGVITYGVILAVFILYASRKGRGFPLFDALARDTKDGSPEASILTPFHSTALAGLMSLLLVGDLAVVGYLVCGWGDAAGEVVGKSSGKHKYSPPLSSDKAETKSLEGSLAVFLVGSVGALVALSLLNVPLPQRLPVALLAGFSGAVGEGVVGSATDNFWCQFLPSVVAWAVVG